jgi:hypothetical protein
MIEKPAMYPNFDIVGKLKNLYVKIPLLQDLEGILIYAKTIKELCGRKPIRKIKNSSSTIHVEGALSDLILGRQEPVKYADPGNPIVTIHIQGCSFPNTLVYLGASINILTMETCNTLGFDSFEPTPIMLQLVDRSVVKLVRHITRYSNFNRLLGISNRFPHHQPKKWARRASINTRKTMAHDSRCVHRISYE